MRSLGIFALQGGEVQTEVREGRTRGTEHGGAYLDISGQVRLVLGGG